MLYLTYLALGLYSIPLITIVAAAITSQLFASESQLVYIAGKIALTFLKNLWESFGVLIVPMVTAFSIPIREADKNIPRKTLWLISVLAFLFLLSIGLYGIISSEKYQGRVEHFGKETLGAFSDVTVSYIKGFLSYFALTLGISFKK